MFSLEKNASEIIGKETNDFIGSGSLNNNSWIVTGHLVLY